MSLGDVVHMDDSKRAEAIWAYSINAEKLIERMLAKGYIDRKQADDFSAKMFEQINDDYLEAFIANGGYAEVIRTYFGSGTSKADYVSLTDIARTKDNESPGYVIQSWLRNRNTIGFLRMWEKRYNSIFNDGECEVLLDAMKTTTFTVTLKQWLSRTNAIGLTSTQGRNGGTFAHPDIACDFHMWLEPEFRLNMIKVFSDLNVAKQSDNDNI